MSKYIEKFVIYIRIRDSENRKINTNIETI